MGCVRANPNSGAILKRAYTRCQRSAQIRAVLVRNNLPQCGHGGPNNDNW
jgi:hypothetical protein